MFGRELAKGEINVKGKIFYFFYGLDHIRQRIRAFHVLRRVRSLQTQPKRILDAGSGDGSLCFALAKRFKNAEKIIGIELDPNLVAMSQPRYCQQYRGY